MTLGWLKAAIVLLVLRRYEEVANLGNLYARLDPWEKSNHMPRFVNFHILR